MYSSENSLQFVDFEGSLPCSQKSVIGSTGYPYESSLELLALVSLSPILLLPFVLHLYLPSCVLLPDILQGSPYVSVISLLLILQPHHSSSLSVAKIIFEEEKNYDIYNFTVKATYLFGIFCTTCFSHKGSPSDATIRIQLLNCNVYIYIHVLL
jgi:hypothetical protein